MAELTNPSNKIRRATTSDAQVVRDALVNVDGRTILDEAAIGSFLSDPSCYILLAMDGDRVIGSLNGYALHKLYRPEPQFLLYEVGVLPEWRNQGAGTALVQAFVEEARSRGAFEVWVLTERANVSALKMYQKCGFQIEDEDAAAVMLNLKW